MYIFIYFFGGEREGKGEERKEMAHIQYFSLFFIILKARYISMKFWKELSCYYSEHHTKNNMVRCLRFASKSYGVSEFIFIFQIVMRHPKHYYDVFRDFLAITLRFNK